MCGLRASFFITLWAPVLCLAAASVWCAEVSQCQVLLWETALTVILWRMHLPHWISEHALGWKRWHSPVFLFFWAWKTVWLLLAEEYTAGPVARISDCETPITHRGHWQQRQVAKCLRAVSWSPVFSFPLQEECEQVCYLCFWQLVLELNECNPAICTKQTDFV